MRMTELSNKSYLFIHVFFVGLLYLNKRWTHVSNMSYYCSAKASLDAESVTSKVLQPGRWMPPVVFIFPSLTYPLLQITI